MEVPRGKKGGGAGAVVIISRYWPPKRLVRDAIKHCLRIRRRSGRIEVRVLEPPNPWLVPLGVLAEEIRLYAEMYGGRVAVIIVPVGLPLSVVEAVREACEVVGAKAYMALVEDKEFLRRRVGASRLFGPKQHRYAYLKLLEEWAVGIVPIEEVGGER